MSCKYHLTENLAIFCRSSIEKFRCETFWTKEPETLEWIGRFNSKAIFIDVGANIGLYSLFAASIHSKMKIYAIEPLSGNYQSIKENIQLNGFDQVIPLKIAVSDREGDVPFHILNEESGSSGSQIIEPVKESGESFKPVKEEMIHCVTVDNLCKRFNIRCDYLKIDIDGREWQVLKGAEKSLESSVQSVLVELNPFYVALDSVHAWMKDRGFSIDGILQSLANHSNNRRSPQGPLNFIYTKTDS
ncbi:putative methyltransferase, FkbM family [Waddlia chondrophila 2032/99]|uniref:Putative methyltransferase, FkbM family n=1 Tax=Waddlia chondrophila 2032/99 TaxID=765953 RepID=F8LBK8_9BACT|nr:putative methyltransferase, FkbM family [Waddlia chondrophila 2032/99]